MVLTQVQIQCEGKIEGRSAAIQHKNTLGRCNRRCRRADFVLVKVLLDHGESALLVKSKAQLCSADMQEKTIDADSDESPCKAGGNELVHHCVSMRRGTTYKTGRATSLGFNVEAKARLMIRKHVTHCVLAREYAKMHAATITYEEE